MSGTSFPAPDSPGNDGPAGGGPVPWWLRNLPRFDPLQAADLAKAAATAQFLDVIGGHLAGLHLEQTRQVVSQMTGQHIHAGNVSSITQNQDIQNGQGGKVRTTAAE